MINIVTAHHGEAKPFIDHYHLHAETRQGLDLYVNQSVSLLVTGQGRDNVEQSLGRLVAAVNVPAQQWWINFGLAGSSRFEPGTLVAIDQVGSWGGNLLQKINCENALGLPVTSCLSRDQPSADYLERGVVDMEAAAVVTILGEVGALEKLGIFKLVSDGPRLSADDLTPAMARALIERHAGVICRAIDGFIAAHVPHFPAT